MTTEYTYTYNKKITDKQYRNEKRLLQIELLKLQEWVINQNKKVAIIFEGRDAAGKGATIKRFVEYLIPKKINIVELGVPTKKQNQNWLRTYHNLLPKKGQITFFDRSWYSRALIQPTMGYCSRSQYNYFMENINNWEKKIIKDGVILIKLYLSIKQDIQSLRFNIRKTSPLKYWKLSDNDLIAQNHWNLFTNFKKQMFTITSTKKNPWIIINANNKMICRLNAMRYVLQHIDYDGKIEYRTQRSS